MSALVLIADADPKRVDRVRRIVELEGAVAVTAADPRQAMLLFVRRQPQLTVLQVDAPEACGLELCRDMKTLTIGRRSAVVVVAPRRSRPAAFDSGCDAFISRHPDIRALQRAVRRLLAATRTAPPAEEIELIA